MMRQPLLALVVWAQRCSLLVLCRWVVRMACEWARPPVFVLLARWSVLVGWLNLDRSDKWRLFDSVQYRPLPGSGQVYSATHHWGCAQAPTKMIDRLDS